jgi:hypothetical protein
VERGRHDGTEQFILLSNNKFKEVMKKLCRPLHMDTYRAFGQLHPHQQQQRRNGGL